MDKDFFTNDFEQLLRERTEEFKMYPSESVWSNIFNKLHPGRRWGIIGGSFLLLLFTASVLVFRTTNQHINSTAALPEKNNYTLVNHKQQTIPGFNTEIQNDLQPGNNIPAAVVKIPFTSPTVRFIKAGVQKKQISKREDKKGLTVISQTKNENNLVTLSKIQDHFVTAEKNNNTFDNIYYKVPERKVNEILELAGVDINTTSAAEKKSVINTATDNINPDLFSNNQTTKISGKRTSRFEWQLYFAPSVSYRALFNDVNNTNLAYAFNSYIPGDINKAVNHTPALGFEMGNAVLYSLTKSIKIKTGLQFNYSRYNIKAYSTNPELTTLRLRGDYNQTEELKVASNYKNYGVYYLSTTISSQNVAVSVPIGVDIKMLGTGNISWYISGSFQPTYIINNKAYLISNDLKNYVRNSELFRKFTMNSGIETFLRVEKGNGVALQIGPQLRYQINSSYTSKYPISEHLIEYGVKLGITKRF